MREHLKRTVICAIAACVMLSVSACEMTDSMSEKRMKEEETVQIESNPLFDEVGDIMTGPETETELDVIVDDEALCISASTLVTDPDVHMVSHKVVGLNLVIKSFVK